VTNHKLYAGPSTTPSDPNGTNRFTAFSPAAPYTVTANHGNAVASARSSYVTNSHVTSPPSQCNLSTLLDPAGGVAWRPSHASPLVRTKKSQPGPRDRLRKRCEIKNNHKTAIARNAGPAKKPGPAAPGVECHCLFRSIRPGQRAINQSGRRRDRTVAHILGRGDVAAILRSPPALLLSVISAELMLGMSTTHMRRKRWAPPILKQVLIHDGNLLLPSRLAKKGRDVIVAPSLVIRFLLRRRCQVRNRQRKLRPSAV